MRAAASGHEDQFRPPSLKGRYRLGEATFAGMGSKEEDAPIPAVRGTAAIERKVPPGAGAVVRKKSAIMEPL